MLHCVTAFRNWNFIRFNSKVVRKIVGNISATPERFRREQRVVMRGVSLSFLGRACENSGRPRFAEPYPFVCEMCVRTFPGVTRTQTPTVGSTPRRGQSGKVI
jgi:hypothetical protein